MGSIEGGETPAFSRRGGSSADSCFWRRRGRKARDGAKEREDFLWVCVGRKLGCVGLPGCSFGFRYELVGLTGSCDVVQTVSLGTMGLCKGIPSFRDCFFDFARPPSIGLAWEAPKGDSVVSSLVEQVGEGAGSLRKRESRVGFRGRAVRAEEGGKIVPTGFTVVEGWRFEVRGGARGVWKNDRNGEMVRAEVREGSPGGAMGNVGGNK